MSKSRPFSLSSHCPILSALAGATLSLCVACGGGGAPAGTPTEGLGLPAGDSGQTLGEMGFDGAVLGDNGTPIHLEGLSGRVSTLVRDADGARALMRGELARAYRLAPGTDFQLLSDKRGPRGLRYLKLAQLHAGIPVVGSQVVVNVEPGGQVLGVLGQLTPDLHLSTSPGMAGPEAVGQALSRLSQGPAVVVKAPALRIYVGDGAGVPVLAWQALVKYIAADGLHLEELLLDAQTGALLAQHPRIYTAIDRDIHDLKGKCLGGVGGSLPGALVMSEGGSTTDPAVQGAYDGTGATYWYYWYMFERDSYDDAGASLTSTVNLQFPAGFGCDGGNAAWIDDDEQMVYGNGDTDNFKNLALSLDVTAHELTHAVTARTSDLTYQNESGALNEAMSDIIGGVGAEVWSDSGGDATGNPASMSAVAKNWKIGEDIVKPGSTLIVGDALRYMNDPIADNYSKDYYPDRIKTAGDSGGVHGNSGIANLAFYLLSEGGKHPHGKTTVEVQGISVPYAAAVFYYSNAFVFTSSTNFKAARYATAYVAQQLFGRCGAEWTNTHRSWDAVGVTGTWAPCVKPRGGF